MTLGEIIHRMEEYSARMLHVPLDALPEHERIAKLFPATMLAMDATLTWFDEPHATSIDGRTVFEAGEIRIPQINFRYGVIDTIYTWQFRQESEAWNV